MKDKSLKKSTMPIPNNPVNQRVLPRLYSCPVNPKMIAILNRSNAQYLETSTIAKRK